MILYTKLFLRIGELYEEGLPPAAPVDILRYREHANPLKNCDCTPFHTLWIDLSRPESELFKALKKDTRYEIRVAEDRDRLIMRNFEREPSGALAEFCEFYDGFAASKGLRTANRAKLSALLAADRLWLSWASEPNGTALVWHAYVFQDRRARLLHSASLLTKSDAVKSRQALGRANRFLHWQDILALKRRAIPILDLGGWYAGSADCEKLRINQFKCEFGGALVTTFNGDKALTMRGRLALAASRFIE